MSFASSNRDPPVKLILAIDIGTTFTAASYCVMLKDTEPFLQEVNKWPKQATGNAKIPSVLYYDQLTVARLRGDETEDEGSLLAAELGNWKKAEWWKLLLRPPYLPMPIDFFPFVLPPGVTVDVVFRDHFAYVLESVRGFVIKKHSSSDKFWDELASSMVVVLTTPNGWEGRHQNRMREAAIKAGLVKPDQRNRVRFVSEGEAAVHFALDCPKVKHSIAKESIILVCDVGGGTTDIGIYKVNGLSPINLDEISSPRCIVAGGVFVNVAAEKYFAKKLQGTKWDTPECITTVVKAFERQVKRIFKGTEPHSFLRIDNSTENDEAHGVILGRLRIPREDMISFFEPSIQTIIGGLDEILSTGRLKVNKAIVIGGFAESDYVYSQMTRWADSHQIPIAKPDGILSKAIAHGAIRWHLHSGVQVRVAKLHYGAEVNVAFDPQDPSMAGRERYRNVHKKWRVREAWKTIVQKNARLMPGDEYTSWFHFDFHDADSKTVEMELYAYRFADPPQFYKTKDGRLTEGIIHIGTIQGDLSRCFNAAPYKRSSSKKKYKTLEYEVCLSFDEIEIKACLTWRENGVQIFGEATILYDL
ncbi:hypothetical protein GALMADRAFT_142720 [Galerina marginata CBS 339.88]|uniref:Uncharacterized protein n=1 Tax=Galerina marginata (strain CBS 339.88) TaxID=685588 RepID=A0A067SQ12_GALM3|nr:hypothetical protein GALMADRAFT_142720 [Galerina marginata CBS 339.88]